MSNLLNRMAARALGTAPLAQPVVPTLFTPNAGLAQNAADVSGADLHSEVEAAAPATTTADRGAFRHKSIHDPAAQNFFVSRIEPSQAERRSQGVVYSNPLSSAAETLPMAEPALHSASESSVLSRGDARVDEPNIERDGDRQTARDSVIAVQTIPATLPGATQPHVNPVLPAQSQNALRQDRVQRAAPEPPVVRVTIGRIDVRAQFSAAASSPAPATRTRSATLTMDEYLKQRNEGKR